MSTTVLEPKPKEKSTARRQFVPGLWTKEINVRNFIQLNYHALLRGRELPRRPDRSERSGSGKS